MNKQRAIIIGAVSLCGILVLILVIRANRPAQKAEVVQQSFLSQAQDNLDKGYLLQAKELYQKAGEDIEDISRLKEIQRKIEEINMKIIFSPILDECSREYIVKPGDSLSKIAGKFGTTVNLIKRANRLESEIIKPSQKLKVNICDFSAVVDKSQNKLFLQRNEELIKTYTVSTGKDNSTPIGTFRIVTKLIDPTWFRTGAVIPPESPENILGTRWIGIDKKGYGIHGTREPDNLGAQVTMGCIRMKDADVEEIFDLLPRGAEVTIID